MHLAGLTMPLSLFRTDGPPPDGFQPPLMAGVILSMAVVAGLQATG